MTVDRTPIMTAANKCLITAVVMAVATTVAALAVAAVKMATEKAVMAAPRRQS